MMSPSIFFEHAKVRDSGWGLLSIVTHYSGYIAVYIASGEAYIDAWPIIEGEESVRMANK